MLKISILLLGLALLLKTTQLHAGEKSLYDFLWLDPDKKVYVLQNKLYKKEHTFYADVGYISNLTSKFQDTSGYTIRAGYYIHEEWGVELMYNSYNNSNNDDYSQLSTTSGVIPFVRRLKSSMGANVIWSPFYGKINTFNQIFYFDWSFGAGFSKIDAESNKKTAGILNVPNRYDSESYSAAVLKTNFKFHVTENIHLSVEYMNQYFKAPSAKNPNSDKLRTNSDLIFMVGFSY